MGSTTMLVRLTAKTSYNYLKELQYSHPSVFLRFLMTTLDYQRDNKAFRVFYLIVNYLVIKFFIFK
jgi:hypothetical protein